MHLGCAHLFGARPKKDVDHCMGTIVYGLRVKLHAHVPLTCVVWSEVLTGSGLLRFGGLE